MLTREVVTLTLIVISCWLLKAGPQGVLRNIHDAQARILKEATRTDNWGNPSIFINGLPQGLAGFGLPTTEGEK